LFRPNDLCFLYSKNEELSIVERFTVHAFATIIVNQLNSRLNKDGADLQKMVLGAEILLHSIPKLTLMIIIAAILGILFQTAVAWISFALIRRYASGLHAKNGVNCTIATLLLFVAVPYILQGIHIHIAVLFLVYIATSIGLFRYAPSDTENRPILGKKKRRRLKKGSIITNFVILILSVLFLDEAFYVMVSIGVVSATVLALPLVYKLLGRSINNYEQYEQ